MTTLNPLTPADIEMIAYLRVHYGDALADRFQHGAQTIPSQHQRKLLHVAKALHDMFPGPTHINFTTALPFFDLPPLIMLDIEPVAQKTKAGHLIVHMACHGSIPLDCPEWPSHLHRPIPRTPMFPISASLEGEGYSRR